MIRENEHKFPFRIPHAMPCGERCVPLYSNNKIIFVANGMRDCGSEAKILNFNFIYFVNSIALFVMVSNAEKKYQNKPRPISRRRKRFQHVVWLHRPARIMPTPIITFARETLSSIRFFLCFVSAPPKCDEKL